MAFYSKRREACLFAEISPGYLRLLLTTYQGLASHHSQHGVSWEWFFCTCKDMQDKIHASFPIFLTRAPLFRFVGWSWGAIFSKGTMEMLEDEQLVHSPFGFCKIDCREGNAPKWQFKTPHPWNLFDVYQIRPKSLATSTTWQRCRSENAFRSRQETRNLAPVCFSNSTIFLPPCQDQETRMIHSHHPCTHTHMKIIIIIIIIIISSFMTGCCFFKLGRFQLSVNNFRLFSTQLNSCWPFQWDVQSFQLAPIILPAPSHRLRLRTQDFDG